METLSYAETSPYFIVHQCLCPRTPARLETPWGQGQLSFIFAPLGAQQMSLHVNIRGFRRGHIPPSKL